MELGVDSNNRLAIWTRCAGERGRLALRARLLERDDDIKTQATDRTGTKGQCPEGASGAGTEANYYHSTIPK